jgi:hypothetical protein
MYPTSDFGWWMDWLDALSVSAHRSVWFDFMHGVMDELRLDPEGSATGWTTDAN